MKPHEVDLCGRNLLKETDLNQGEFLYLGRHPAGRNIALIFEKT